jgi:hypothetical protein
MRRLNRSWIEACRLARASDGGVAVIFGFVLPVRIDLAGLGIDSAAFRNHGAACLVIDVV